MCCGRPSSRPYSYAVERCGDFQCIINDCPYMQCRGEWKLAHVAPGGDAYAAASPEGRTAFPHGLCCGRPSSRPYSYAVGCAVIFSVLLMIVHTGSVGASGSSPALRPPMRVHVGWHPRRGYSVFPQCMCFGRPSSRPYSYAVCYAVICNASSIVPAATRAG